MDEVAFWITPAVVVVSCLTAPLTVALSGLILWLYRRSVQRGMRLQMGAESAASVPSVAESLPAAIDMPLGIATLDRTTPLAPAGSSEAFLHSMQQSLRRAVSVYVGGGLAYALIYAVAFAILMTNMGTELLQLDRTIPWYELYPARILFWTWWYAWPAVLALCLIATTERRKRVGLVALYLAALIPIALVAQAAGMYVLLLLVMWLVLNGLGTLLLLAFLSRRVRSVGPLVLALTVVALTGATLVFLLVMVLFRRDNPLILAMAGSLGAGVFYLAALFGLTLAALLGALLLVWIRRSYQAKRISDQSILLDAMWLFFAVFSSWLYLPWSWTGLLAAAAAFVGYKLVVNAGLASAMRPVKEGAPGPTLLLLRVFSLGRRSERLFDILSQRWLRLGSIALIAGEDLATTTIEPHEFLAFLSGRLSRQFVSGKADLEQRLRDLDTRPDADGRYRVNEFFCRGDTWQMTMRELTARSDAILMDLRSFGPTNQGCIYELEQLLGIAPLERIVLLVDDTTDRPFLEQTLRGLWAQVPSDSPNRGPRPRGVRLFHVSGGSEGEVQVLLQLLCGARTQPQKDMSIQPAG